jgi:hypothetical protein
MEATSIKIYLPDGTTIEKGGGDSASKFRLRVEGDTLKIDNGETVDQFTGVPFHIVFKKTSPGPAF